MKFAIVNGDKAEATKGANGTCPICGAVLIAKCGEVKMKHWAHKQVSDCDRWWENETEWHRSWKNNFPEQWQEVPLPDEETGEKHIADVRTEHGLVIEFQHSHIDPQERNSRERFYKNMVWVVDGTRLKNDYHRFLDGWKKDFRATGKKWIYFVYVPNKWFPSDWVESAVPVIFDYKGIESVDDPADKRNNIYCLFPGRLGKEAVFAVISRDAFISSAVNGEWTALASNFVERVGKAIAAPAEEKKQIPNKPVRVFRRRESPYIFERGRWRRRRHL